MALQPSPESEVPAMKSIVRIALLGVIMFSLFGCTSVPDGLSPVTGYDAGRYLGTWHEIARLDHSFERGLTRVTAEYAKRPDGTIAVVNRGFDAAKGKWKEARGKAKFIGDPGVGSLKVSFFGPFYAPYNIIDLDRERYSYAMVCSSNTSYLWILSRTPTLDPAIRDRLIARARDWGFNTNGLIFVRQEGQK